MKVLYSKPDESDFRYNRWFDNNGTFDIWYKDVVMLYNYREKDIPNELKLFLDKWNKKMLEYKETYVEMCPVKLAHIEFIYEDVVYVIEPINISASYMTSFMSDKEYEVSWDSLFEAYQYEIRKDLKSELGVEHSRYWGMLD